ncbi:esterase/lipase family protein [Luteimonas sp. R10]|uniref:esterase/lipase family protein n=1 Tax=Luteimonas sp. R10 TaxID=3108176 RepID=UPI00308FF68C|nr:alpha/beta hydrolase [Luteimonas sp. R10]
MPEANQTGTAAARVERVVLLHGLWMPSAAMRWFAARLRGAGFVPELLGYPSILGDPDATVRRLVARLDGGGRAHLVGHSLGGLVALQALADARRPAPGRVVCLGTPLCGSGAAKALSRRKPTALYLGRSGALLRRGCAAWPPDAEVGMIAGRVPRGLGALFAGFDGPHDGTVAVAETRAPGLTDHVVVDASHSGLLFSREAAERAARFLREGRF